MNSRSDREEVLTAVMSVPKLPYNKDDKRQKNEYVLVGTLRIYSLFPFYISHLAIRCAHSTN
jgi:hypothetical protein